MDVPYSDGPTLRLMSLNPVTNDLNIRVSLANAEPAEATFAEAAQAVKGEIDPPTDIHASADYRSDITAVLVQRALQTAAKRAGER